MEHAASVDSGDFYEANLRQLHTREPVRFHTWNQDHRPRFTLGKALDDVPGHDEGGETKPKLGHSDTRQNCEVLRENVDPGRPLAMVYLEKNGSGSSVTGDRCGDAVHAIKSMSKGPSLSHKTENAAGISCMIVSRDGREMASATPFAAEGTQVRDKRKSYSI